MPGLLRTMGAAALLFLATRAGPTTALAQKAERAPAPKSHRGDHVYDVRDYGARPNDPASDASGRTSVDRAWDAIFEAFPKKVGPEFPPCTIYFPGGTWYHNDPLLADRDHLTIKGEGRDTTRIVPAPARACTSIQLGLRRAPENINAGKDAKGEAKTNPSNGRAWADPATLGPEHWVDLHGKLDASMVGATGKRWGFRTNGDSHLTFQSSPWSCGLYDYYAATRQLTFDLCLDGRGATINGTDTSMIGCNDPLYGPSPFGFNPIGPNRYRFMFRTADQVGPGLQWRNFDFQVPLDRKGVQRVAVQVDLARAAVSAYADGVQLPCSPVTTGGPAGSSAWEAGSNLAFRANHVGQPLNVGSYAIDQFNSYNEGGQGTIADLSICGMKLSKGLRYLDKGAGSKQVAAKGGAVDDKYRYGADGDPAMIACLTLDDPPANHPRCRYDGRMAHWSSNGTRGNGWFMSTNTQGGNNGWVVKPVVRDLTVVGQQPWGDGISIGGVISFAQVKDVTIHGGFFRSIGGMAMGSSYPIEVTGCVLDNAFDAAYQGDSQIINRLEFTSNQMGTAGLRLRGCELKSSNLYFGGQQTFNGLRPPGGAIAHLVRLHAGQYAGTYGLTFSFDGEDPAIPTRAQVEVDNHQTPTTVTLRDCKFGSQAPSAPAAIILHDGNDATAALKQPLRFLADGCTITLVTGGEPRAFLLTDGPLARGNLRDCQLIDPAKTQHIKNAGPGGIGHVRWTYGLGDFPEKGPTVGTWEAGCFASPNADGTTTYCTAGGTVGGPKPPKFVAK